MNLETPQLFTEAQLEEEKRHINITNNGKTIEYQFTRIPHAGLQMIQFIHNGSNDMRLEVAMNTWTAWPVKRDPTMEEIMKFMDLATHTFPDSPITKTFCEFIERQAGYLQSVAAANKVRLR